MKRKICLLAIPLVFSTIAVFAQAPRAVTIGGRLHYQHGLNKATASGSTDTREATDSVMVHATMHYFVMPDPNYNKAYADGLKKQGATVNDTLATNLTESQFEWSGYATTDVFNHESGNGNTLSTSPHVTITWNKTGSVTLNMKEHPKKYLGTPIPQSIINNACVGSTDIPVIVLEQPTVAFGLRGNDRVYGVCTGNANHTITLPLMPGTSGKHISDASQVEVIVDIKRNGTDFRTNVTLPVKLENNRSGGEISFNVTEFGVYEVTVKSISDRIAKKCNLGTSGFLGNISSTTSENTFTYILMAAPSSGPAYHVPNNY